LSAAIFLASLCCLAAAEPPNLLVNPSFEPGPDGAVKAWVLDDEDLSSWTTKRARTGKNALLVRDLSSKLGSSATSAQIPVKPNTAYTVEAWSFMLSGSGIGMYVQGFDRSGKQLSSPVEHYHRALSTRKRRWRHNGFVIKTQPTCAKIRIWLHSYSGARVETFIDDLSVREGALVKEEEPPGMKPFQKVPVHVSEGPRPSLLVTRQELADMKAAAEKYEWAKTALAGFLKGAERRLEHPVPIPDRGGGWYHWYACPKDGAGLKPVDLTHHKCPKCGAVYTGEPYDTVAIMGEHNKLAANARDFGLAYALTGRPEFAKRAKAILVGYADRYAGYEMHDVRGPSTRNSAGKVGPQTLDESVWLIPVAQAYDFVVDTMSQAEQQHIEKDLLRAAVAVIQRNNAGISNWQSWHNAAIGAVAFALRDKELADAAINGKSGFQFQMENSVTDDGFWFEGSWGYHYYALSSHLQLTEMAVRSGMDLYRNPRYKGLYEVSMLFMAPNRILPAFHDGHLANGLASPSYYEVAYRRWHDPMFAWAIHQRKRGWDSLLRGTPDVPEQDQPAQKSVNFTGLGWAVLRSGTSRDGMYLALDYGPHGGGHGHPDKLGFSFYGLGDFLAHDPGCVAYGLPIHGEWYRQTISHNTVVVNRRSQDECAGDLDFYVASPRLGVVSASADDAYYPTKFRRLAVLTHDMLLLVDDLADDRDNDYDWAFHGVGEFASSLPFAARAEAPGDKSGYQHIEDVTSAATGDTWQVDWTSPKRSMRLTMLGEPGTEVIAGKGWGPSSLGKVPMVLARRHTKTTRYVAAVQPYRGDAPQMALTSTELGNGLLVTATSATGQTHVLRGKLGQPVKRTEISMDADFAAVESAGDVQNVILANGRSLSVGDGFSLRLDEPGSVAVEHLRPGLWFVQNDSDAPRKVRLQHADCAAAKAYRLDRDERVADLPLDLAGGAWTVRLPAKSQAEIIVSGPSLKEFRTAAGKAEAEAAEQALRAKLPPFPVKPLIPPVGAKPAAKTIVVQAEDFTGQGGGEVRVTDTKTAADGKCFLMWNDPGHWLEWTFEVPTAAAYQLQFRYCTVDNDAERAILIDGAYPAETAKVVACPSTGGYSNGRDDWQELTLGGDQPAALWLKPGQHTIRIYNLRKPVNLDWLRLAPYAGGK
jgi:hypothetical protein